MQLWVVLTAACVIFDNYAASNSRFTHCNLLFLQALSEQEVVHFDLKCDNVLLDMLPGASIEDFWQPATDQPAFRVVLADFGDSCDFSQSGNKFTTR